MPITKQQIPIPFTGGVDTKSDPHQVLAGNLLELTNGQFTKKGQVNKRFGYDILNTNLEGGGNISSAEAISAFNKELCLFDSNNIYSYLSATGNWLDRGNAVSVITTNKQIIRTSDNTQENPDVASVKGIECYAWEDSGGGVRYSVLDSTTKAFAVADQLVDISGVKPKVITFQNKFYIFYSDNSNNILYRTINPLNPTNITSITSLITDGYSGFSYDVAVIDTSLFIGYLSSSDVNGEIILNKYNTNLVFSNSVVVDTNSNAIDGYGISGCLNVVGDSGDNIWISWGNGTQVRTACYSFTLVNVLPSTLVDTQRINTLTGIESTSPLVLQLVYEIYDPISYNQRICSAKISRLGTVEIGQTLRSVGLASKAFNVDGSIYVNLAFETKLQATYFTLKLTVDPYYIIGKTSAGVGGGLRTNNMLSESVNLDGIILWANLVAGTFDSEGNAQFTLLGVNSTTLDFDNSNKFLSVTQSNNLLFVGGILSSYDGVSVVEQGFHVYPENITVETSSGGGLSAGEYLYQITYEWSDNLGQIQRSAPSVPVPYTANNGDSVILTIPTLRLTAKQNPRSNVSIVIYRTQVNETESYFQVSSTIAPLENNITVDTVQFVDVLSDDDIASNALIYTSGGVLENMSPPANSLISLYQNRVIIGGLEDGNLLWFSKNKFDNSSFSTTPVEFAAENTIGVDPRGGAITALGLLDSNLLIFKEAGIFLLTGDGPNDTGLGDTFADPQFITSDAGCKNPNSVVVSPVGMMFQSSKGIYLLDRNLQVSYIGAPVEQYNNLTITSATLNSKANQIIFTTLNGPALVYDYYFQQWSTWTNHQSQDSDIFEDDFVFVKSNAKVYQQDVNSFVDGTLPISLSFTTPNLSFAQLNGFSRVFKCFLLGSFQSKHTLNVSVAYDFNPNYTEFATVNVQSASSVWGGDGYWGESSPWGGVYQIYQYRLDFKTQRCTAIRLKISDTDTAPLGEGYSISALTFEVGVLNGGNRLPKVNVTGTQ